MIVSRGTSNLTLTLKNQKCLIKDINTNICGITILEGYAYTRARKFHAYTISWDLFKAYVHELLNLTHPLRSFLTPCIIAQNRAIPSIQTSMLYYN